MCIRDSLQPSGLHLMLFDVKNPLKAQQNVELTLSFSHNPSVTIQVPVFSPLQEKRAQEADSTAQPAHHH